MFITYIKAMPSLRVSTQLGGHGKMGAQRDAYD